MRNGLSARDTATIHDIFRKYPEVTQVHLFGSRAKGAHKPGSDVDLAIMNVDVSAETVCAIKNDFEESDLPYLFDLVHYPSLNHKEFKDHINRVGTAFYKTPPTG